jgi:hypothetical protein
MEKNLRDMFDSISVEELSSAECADFDLKLAKSKSDRILALTMRKAGFDMKEKRNIKKKRIVGICLAAALAFGGAIGAYAAYSSRVWNGMKWKFDDSVTDSDIANLESATSEFDGTVIQNTFDGLDFTVEGIVSDSTQSYAVVTVKKSDGTAFDEPQEGYEYQAGLMGSRTISSSSRVIESEENYPWCFGYPCTYNDDGTLSIALYDPDYTVNIEGYSDGKVRFNIVNLYCVEAGDDDLLNKSISAQNAYAYPETENPDDSDNSDSRARYENLRDSFYSAMSEKSLCTFEGEYEIEYNRPTADNVLELSPETNDLGCTVTVSSMTVKLSKENNDEEKQSGYELFDDISKITIVMSNGESYVNTDSEISGGASEVDGLKISSQVYVNLTKPINPDDLEKIIVEKKSGEEIVIEIN